MKYKVSFEFETDGPLDFPRIAIQEHLDCEFDNLHNILVQEVNDERNKKM